MNPLVIDVLIGLLIASNAAAFLAYWIDKSRARRNLRRLPEARLLQLSFVGPVGSVFGIWWVRHKTRKASYLLKYLLVMVLSLAGHLLAGYAIYLNS